MIEHQPGLILLFASALCILWLTPLSAWWMLSGETNPAARIWFAGTTFYALVATIFIFGSHLPPFIVGPINSGFSILSVLCLAEALRREISNKPPPYILYATVLIADIAILTAFVATSQAKTYGLATHLIAMSLIECAILALIVRVHRIEQSKALWLIFSVLLLFVASNMARVIQFCVTGQMPILLDFSFQSNAAIIINFCSVVFYCYGYWGFVVEKNKRLAIDALQTAMRSREETDRAHYREHLANTLHEQKTAFLDRLTKVEQRSRSAALAASIAHEINQPLAAMAIHVAEAKRLLEQQIYHEKLLVFIRRIEFDHNRISDIISRLRAIFNEIPLQAESNNLDSVIQHFISVSDIPRRDDMNITLNLGAPINFLFSVSEIEHVLQNLLRNASEAVLAHSRQDKSITIATWIEENFVYLSVSDNGAGVASEVKMNLFNPLASSKRGGMGLGLWLSRFIVERHGGTLRHDDTFAKGARFILKLPNTIPIL